MVRSKILPAVVFLLIMAGAAWSAGGVMSVQVRDGKLRGNPSFLAPVVSAVSYGDRVQSLQQRGDWLQVRRADGRTGWIHQSALTQKRVTYNLEGPSAGAAASGEELALAGKGFNSDIEAQFRAQHSDIDFTWVDRMERFRISPREILGFLKEGGMQPLEGGAR